MVWYSLKYAFSEKDRFVAIIPEWLYERSPFIDNNPQVRGQFVFGWLKWRVYLHIVKHSKEFKQ